MFTWIMRVARLSCDWLFQRYYNYISTSSFTMQVKTIKMANQQQQDKLIGFKTIKLFKDQTLGIGSYGKVCRAKCDDLLCAAKLLHETLFDPTAEQLIAPRREHRLPFRRFEQECEFLSAIRHPNIVQYLGIYQDPDTGLPVLLMELMDKSLTHFLESSPQPIPYHIQVNVCHDITQALSFLHSNSIVHRDLSSNNVLLNSSVRAKVTDFGMVRLGDQNPRATQLTLTICPGTDVYMPPEAVQDKPVYTEKIDCFSFGVITLQILSRQFPKPGDRRKKIQISQPGLPPVVEVPVSEIERRQNHISVIDPNHTLLRVVLGCLKDKDDERPSAQQLCERVVALKEDPQYNESMEAVEARNSIEQGRSDERSLRHKYTEQFQAFKQIIQSQGISLKEKEQMIAQRDQALGEKDKIIEAGQQQLRQLEKEKNQAIDEKDRELRQKVGEISQLGKEKSQTTEEKARLERQLEYVKQQLEESERVLAQVPALRPTTDTASKSKEQSSMQPRRGYIKLTWSWEGEKAPCKMYSSYRAVANDSTLYVKEKSQTTEEKARLERQLEYVKQQLEESERVLAQVPALRPTTDTASKSKEQSSMQPRRGYIKLTWSWEGEKAPCKMYSSYRAVANDSTLYRNFWRFLHILFLSCI